MKEIWKDIKGYEGYYQVSNLGNVRSLDRVQTFNNGSKLCKRIVYGKTISNYIGKCGYVRVRLARGGKKKTTLLHRLIALHFIPNPDNKKEVNHINGVKSDYSISNLEWMTHKENIQHAHDNGLAKNKGLKGRLNPMYGKTYGENPRAKIVIDMSNGIFYSCAKEAAEAHDIKVATLRSMLQGKNPNRTNLNYV